MYINNSYLYCRRRRLLQATVPLPPLSPPLLLLLLHLLLLLLLLLLPPPLCPRPAAASRLCRRRLRLGCLRAGLQSQQMSVLVSISTIKEFENLRRY